MTKAKRYDAGYSRRRFLRISGSLTAGLGATALLAACGELAVTSTALPAAITDTTPATSVALTPGPGSPSTGGGLPFAGRSLTVFVYSGLTEDTFRNVYAPAFEKATGAKIVLSPGWWDAAAKLQSSPDPSEPATSHLSSRPKRGTSEAEGSHATLQRSVRFLASSK